MSRWEVTAVLQGLFSSEEQVARWAAAARTPESRARIRRWSRFENGGIATCLVGIALLLLAPFVSIAVVVWSSVTERDATALLWWIGGVAISVPLFGVVVWVVAARAREHALYADGRVSVGTVDRTIEHPGSGDDATWWDLRISARAPDGTTLRRRLHLEGADLDRRRGGPVRFRHNTLDPDDLDDVLLLGWSASPRRRSRETRRFER